MKTIGLLGGMSFESTADYYKIINSEIQKKLGGNSSAKILLHSFNFQEIEELQVKEEWTKIGDLMTEATVNLHKSGADFILICTNSVHKIAPQLEENSPIPLIHIADATAQEIKKQNISKVGLLGTKWTMEEDFYKTRLKKHGIEVITPEKEDRKCVHKVIYEELCKGLIIENSRIKYEKIISKLEENGAQGVVLGCTEIPLLIKTASIPLFNTTMLHALEAVQLALFEE